MANSKPNIVFIHCDSMDGRALGCMGLSAAHTPNIDKLAQSGTIFENTYSNHPICVPSRASMFSGKYSHKCQAWNNYKGLEKEHSTIFDLVQKQGYQCGIFGKTDYLSGKHTIRARVSAWTRSVIKGMPEYNMPGPRILEDCKERTCQRDWNAVDSGLEWLNNRDKKNPFMLYIGPNLPHPRFQTSPYWLDKINPDKVSMPEKDRYNHPVMENMKAVKNWTKTAQEHAILHTRRIYYAMIAEVDYMVGTVMQAVEKASLKDNTFFIFSSDHGEMNMEHDQFYKMNHYEPSARVPLLIAGPGVRNNRVSSLISLIDMYPTLLDICGADHEYAVDGHSLMNELAGSKNTHRQTDVLSQFHGTTSCTGAYMLRSENYKYIAYPDYEPLLFNLENDPDEIKNLAPQKTELAKQMDEKLRNMIDYPQVEKQVRDYDKSSFAEWRTRQIKDGTYNDNMSQLISGWDDIEPSDIKPWDDQMENMVKEWLSSR